MKTLDEAIANTRSWVEDKLSIIRKISDEKFRRILLCSLIEAFAQHDANYPPKNSSKYFAEFILKYSEQYKDILQIVCPVTLYYDYNSRYDLGDLYLHESMIYDSNSLEMQNEADRLLEILPEDDREKARKRHQYVGLIYAMRNKIVHEMIQNGTPFNFHEGNQIPIISTESKMLDNKYVPYRWTLYIPEEFIENVIKDAIANYLNECQQHGKMPFENNTETRKSRYAWYD